MNRHPVDSKRLAAIVTRVEPLSISVDGALTRFECVGLGQSSKRADVLLEDGSPYRVMSI